jgi:hypothetical protein
MSAREVATSIASTDTLTLDGHGFETNDELVFRAVEGGTLSSPLVAGTTYYAIRLNEGAFKVAATEDGVAINLTTDGALMLVATPLPIDDVLEAYSRWVDGFLPAHAVPLAADDTSAPALVKMLVATLAAKRLMHLAGQASESLNEAELAAKAQLERFAAGLPLRDAAATAPTNKAAVSSLSITAADPRGWGSGTLP